MKSSLHLLLLMAGLLSAEAAWSRADPLTLTPNNMFFSGSADGTPVGTPVTSNWIGEASTFYGYQCEKKSIFRCWINQVQAQATGQQIPGVYYDDGNSHYPVYQLPGVKGIGYAFGLKDNNDSVSYVPIDPHGGNNASVVYPARGSAVSKGVNRISLKAKVVFVVTGEHLETGVYAIPYTVIANTWSNYGGSHRGNNSSLVAINPTVITVTARGCEINTRSLTYEMGDVALRDLPAIGSQSPEVTKSIALSCDADVRLHASMTDQSQLTNTSTLLSLSRDSTAAGVAMRFWFNEDPEPVTFGPDISSTGQANQRWLQTIVSDRQNYTLNLKTRYVRTGDLKPGSANGLASVTFSYQ